MKFDDMRKVCKVYVPPAPKEEPTYDEVNEAFEALGDPSKFVPLIINGQPRVLFRRCMQCAYFSVVVRCPTCSNHPGMLPVDLLKIPERMENSGLVCGNFPSGSCIQRIDGKSGWCKDCKCFWETELSSSRPAFKLPTGITLLSKKNVAQQVIDVLLDEDGDDKEDDVEWEEECDELLDKLDTACNLLCQLRYLLNYLSDPQLTKSTHPDDRKEMKSFVGAIEEIVEACGFDVDESFKEPGEDIEDPITAFNVRDKEFLEKQAGDEFHGLFMPPCNKNKIMMD